MAVLGLVLSALIVQTGTMITGIPGTNYIFTIILAIWVSFSILIYEGKRWRFFFQMTLFCLLILPTNLSGPPFNIFTRIPMVVNSFIIDIVSNSLYHYFRKYGKLLWWSTLFTTLFWLMNPFLGITISQFFVSPEHLEKLILAVDLLLPVILIEAILGGYFGYKIHFRLKSN